MDTKQVSSLLDLKEVKEMVNEATAKFAEKVKKVDYSATDTKALDSKGETIKFLNAIVRDDRAYLSKAALNEGTGSAGGFLVPTEFANTILRYAKDYSQLERLATSINVNSNVYKLNALATEPTVSWVGEGAQKPESNPTFAEATLNIRKIAAIATLTEELQEDSELDVLNLLAERFGIGLAKLLQTDMLNSTVSGSEGIFQVAGVTNIVLPTGQATYANVTLDDLFAMEAKLSEVTDSEEERANAAFLMSASVYNVLRTQKASTAGSYMWPSFPSMNGDIVSPTGRKILIINQAPTTSAGSQASTKFIALFNPRTHLFIGNRKGLVMKLGTEGTVASQNMFEQDMVGLRVVRRVGFTTAMQSGIVTLTTSAT